MRAVVYDHYGPPEVLRFEDVPRPVPKDDAVLVRIHATTVNRTDCGVRSAETFVFRFLTGLRRPRQRILGSEFAGEVEAVGPSVKEFAVGDHVFISSGYRRGCTVLKIDKVGGSGSLQFMHDNQTVTVHDAAWLMTTISDPSS